MENILDVCNQLKHMKELLDEAQADYYVKEAHIESVRNTLTDDDVDELEYELQGLETFLWLTEDKVKTIEYHIDSLYEEVVDKLGKRFK